MGTLKWWQAWVGIVGSYVEEPAYDAPYLPDLRAGLRENFDDALDNPESELNRFRQLIED